MPAPRITTAAAAAVSLVKNCEVIRATFPRAMFFLDLHSKAMRRRYQTFNLAIGNRRRIRKALLDRFLACMKPASITERQPCAGVFFFSAGWFGGLQNKRPRDHRGLCSIIKGRISQ
jgi:hypothetical protein